MSGVRIRVQTGAPSVGIWQDRHSCVPTSTVQHTKVLLYSPSQQEVVVVTKPGEATADPTVTCRSREPAS